MSFIQQKQLVLNFKCSPLIFALETSHFSLGANVVLSITSVSEMQNANR